MYGFVKAYGINPDRLAQNICREGGKRVSADDDEKLPIDLADSLTDGELTTGEKVLEAAREMYSEELFANPKMRKHFRLPTTATASLAVTGPTKVFSGLTRPTRFTRSSTCSTKPSSILPGGPKVFLKMMRAEEDRLIDVKLALQNERDSGAVLYTEFASDNFSERADAWNDERQKVLAKAFAKLEAVITKGFKESLRTACQDELLKTCKRGVLQATGPGAIQA